MKYVIIGNGTAAVGAIEGIRSADKVGPITIISTEPYHVYGRPLISYMLLGKTTEEKMLQYRPDDFYEKNNVTTMLGRTVQHIDPKKQTVSLASGESVPYDRLCICTGSRPVRSPDGGSGHGREQNELHDARRREASERNARRDERQARAHRRRGPHRPEVRPRASTSVFPS